MSRAGALSLGPGHCSDCVTPNRVEQQIISVITQKDRAAYQRTWVLTVKREP